LNYAVTFSQAYIGQLIKKQIRSDYYLSLQAKPFRFFDSTPVGDLVSRATLDLTQLETFLNTWVGVMSNAIFTVLIMLSIMYAISPIMTVIAFIPMIISFYLNSKLFTSTMPLFRKMQIILGRLGSYIQQNILGMKVVRIFRREEELETGFKKVENVYVKTAINAGRIQSIYTPSAPTILTLGIVMVYLYGGNLIVSASTILTIGDLTLFARYMLRLAMPLRDLSMLIGQWINAASGLERVHAIEDGPKETEDRPDAADLKIAQGRVEFKNVTFGYEKGRPVLKNLNFTINPGEKIAILGSTGSGKTSLIYLIPRFYKVDSGSILIDGIELDRFKMASLRRQIGIVMQDVFIFSGTIAENIAFGAPDATRNEIVRAANLARIQDFIESLPHGYDTIVGERGINLSGGQRQRITIARALAMNPKILILDDSLSFVDAKTENEIQAAIDEAMKGRTSFIIAQRLSTIKNADRIMVLDDGKIVEFGTHHQLMSNEGIYKRIYETQFLEKVPEAVQEVKRR
ncbi:MAG TPA: ABC transporter ATP-binding protein, partial [Candidatus Bathyarchaeia archaeon]|nr:ABC transporter ATP-binding protein [Candidatus Bathyarchaeia archaeon]